LSLVFLVARRPSLVTRRALVPRLWLDLWFRTCRPGELLSSLLVLSWASSVRALSPSRRAFRQLLRDVADDKRESSDRAKTSMMARFSSRLVSSRLVSSSFSSIRHDDEVNSTYEARSARRGTARPAFRSNCCRPWMMVHAPPQMSSLLSLSFAGLVGD
jgi:hypothetical protein